MIKLTLKEALAVSEALRALPSTRGASSFHLSRIRIALKPELEAYVEQERALIAEHGGQIQPDGKRITWPAPKEGETPADVAFKKARDEVLDTEIEVDREPVNIKAVLGTDPARQPDIEPEFFVILEKIIVE